MAVSTIGDIAGIDASEIGLHPRSSFSQGEFLLDYLTRPCGPDQNKEVKTRNCWISSNRVPRTYMWLSS